MPLKKALVTVRHRLRASCFVCASGVKSSRVRVISMRLRLPPGTVGCIMLITRLTSNLDHVCNKSPLQECVTGGLTSVPTAFALCQPSIWSLTPDTVRNFILCRLRCPVFVLALLVEVRRAGHVQHAAVLIGLTKGILHNALWGINVKKMKKRKTTCWI